MKTTAIADVTEGTILARVEIEAPIERVWKAITTEELAKWWGADGMYRTTKHTVDLRAGGRYRSDGMGEHGPFHVEGSILEVEPPRRLVQTWEPSWSQQPPTTVTWMLEPITTGTRLTLRHTGFTDGAACGDHATGWERVLAWLGGYTSVPKKYWQARLLPPRPTFMLDMTPDERALMGAHSQYWRGRLAEGIAIAFGPVAGPTGGYGLGLFQASDEAALVALQAEDPVIKANVGFRYENAPMAALVY
ncbi:MAG: SRPBCC domain-containing protein [Kofleriaceae bacterium]